MMGKARRFETEMERDVALAWQIENFARAGKQFRNLNHYIEKMRPKPPQTAEQVIAIFETFAAHGLATIREVNRA